MLNKNIIGQINKIVFRFLDPKRDKVFIFGSRASDKAMKFSDIYIGIETKRKIRGSTIEEIKELFEESDIPYTVDVVDFSDVSDKFKKVAKQKVIYLN